MYKFKVEKEDVVEMIGEPNIYLIQRYKGQRITPEKFSKMFSIGEEIKINGNKMIIKDIKFYVNEKKNEIINGLFAIVAE